MFNQSVLTIGSISRSLVLQVHCLQFQKPELVEFRKMPSSWIPLDLSFFLEVLYPFQFGQKVGSILVHIESENNFNHVKCSICPRKTLSEFNPNANHNARLKLLKLGTANYFHSEHTKLLEGCSLVLFVLRLVSD